MCRGLEVGANAVVAAAEQKDCKARIGRIIEDLLDCSWPIAA
jgi:hypothetical protein